MATKSRYYLVEHMLGPTVLKTVDKRKITTWLKKLYDDASDEVRNAAVEDARIDLTDCVDLD